MMFVFSPTSLTPRTSGANTLVGSLWRHPRLRLGERRSRARPHIRGEAVDGTVFGRQPAWQPNSARVRTVAGGGEVTPWIHRRAGPVPAHARRLRDRLYAACCRRATSSYLPPAGPCAMAISARKQRAPARRPAWTVIRKASVLVDEYHHGVNVSDLAPQAWVLTRGARPCSGCSSRCSSVCSCAAVRLDRSFPGRPRARASTRSGRSR